MMSDDTEGLTEEEAGLLRNLVGVREIADELGVPKSTVSSWDSRRDTTGFPEPVERLNMGPIYDLRAVRAWFEGRQP